MKKRHRIYKRIISAGERRERKREDCLGWHEIAKIYLFRPSFVWIWFFGWPTKVKWSRWYIRKGIGMLATEGKL